MTVSDGLITTIVDNSVPFNYFGTAPSLNATGTVAFVAGVNRIDGGVSGIYKGNGGPLTTIADLSGQFSYLSGFYSYEPSINASGTVAFGAALDAGGGGGLHRGRDCDDSAAASSAVPPSRTFKSVQRVGSASHGKNAQVSSFSRWSVSAIRSLAPSSRAQASLPTA